MIRFTRVHLAVSLALVVVTAFGSYAYFQVDEYFQILQWTNYRLGIVGADRMPWELGMEMRSFFQPMIYEAIARALGLRDVFAIALAARLATGIACWAALAAFVRTTTPWVAGEEAKKLHVRVVTLAGFLPYLFVRTSSETMSMAAFTAAFAVALAGAGGVAGAGAAAGAGARARRLAASGALMAIAFEARYQTAILGLGLVAWLAFVARVPGRRLVWIAAGGAPILAIGVLCDRVGYGHVAFPAWSYVKLNLFEGAAALFGTEPPFAYLWLSPANLFFPVVVVLMLLVFLAWARAPRHPLTWTTMPFFVVHALLSHKEERFLFPMAILATGLVSVAIAPGDAAHARRVDRIAAALWSRRGGVAAKALAAWSTAVMLFLAVWPVGWNHHVRFQRYVHDALGGELHAFALPAYDLGTPAFHGIYDVDKEPADVIAASDARAWLVADTPSPGVTLRTGDDALDARLTLVWSELPCFDSPRCAAVTRALAAAYDAREAPPLRPLTFRTLYRLAPLTDETRRPRSRTTSSPPPP